MANPEYLKHIKVDSFVTSQNYKVSPRGDGSNRIFPRDRTIHGNKLISELQQIEAEKEALEMSAQEDLVLDDAVYVDFYSAFDVTLAFDSFDSTARKLKHKLLSIHKETQTIEGEERTYYRVTVLLSKGGIEKFITNLEKYIQTEKLKDFNFIEEIKLATLQSFWAEPASIPFPSENEEVWWEVWFRRTNSDETDNAKVDAQIATIGAIIGEQKITFPEHIIRLVKATPKQLSDSLMFLDNLSELRRPKEVSEFFTNLNSTEQAEFIEDLINRTDNLTSEDAVAICILDTGVQNGHPLLANFLPDSNMYSWKADWGNIDNQPNGGHGTGMAGLALYGDLNPVLESSDRIQIFHQLESVKILNQRDPNDPLLYGNITEEACSTPIVDYPNRKRVYCLAVTANPTIDDENSEYWGRPSSWSSAIDKITFGEGEDKQLIFISGGNVNPQKHSDYKTLNETTSVEDPAQAFNAITVGAITYFDRIDPVHSGYSLLANRGDLSPSSSTSLMWGKKWSVKPDIVLEGGNYAYNKYFATKLDSLQMLSTHSDYQNIPFQTFGDTSGATALASKMAAELLTEYPMLWPETIRGLLIHSADWNEQMLSTPLNRMNGNQKRNLLRVFGYGIPDIMKAKHSLKNSLTLIAENRFQPFVKDKSSIKYNNYHLYELPWPKEVLSEIVFENDAKVTVTLSYFIEPNPGTRMYSNTFSYQSHGLNFRMIGKDETPDTFLKRISTETREEGESGFAPEPWMLGPTTREKGSIQKDMIIMSGADLATRNLIAIYPKAGWYKTRKKLEKYNSQVRYSLVISIETPNVNVDLYQPIMNQIAIPITI